MFRKINVGIPVQLLQKNNRILNSSITTPLISICCRYSVIKNNNNGTIKHIKSSNDNFSGAKKQKSYTKSISYQTNVKKYNENKNISKNIMNNDKEKNHYNSSNNNNSSPLIKNNIFYEKKVGYNVIAEIEEDPYVRYISFVKFYGIQDDHVDGTFNADKHLSVKSMTFDVGEKFSTSLEFFTEIRCQKDIKNILKNLIHLPLSKWNGKFINSYFEAIGFLKYDCNLPENEYTYHRDTLESRIKSIPIDSLRLDAENILDCIYNSKLTQIDNFKDNYQPSKTFYNIFVREALYQGKLSNLEEVIKKRFKQNIWNDVKLFKNVISNNNKYKKDGLEYVLKSSLHLDRHLYVKERKLLGYLNEALGDKYEIIMENVNEKGVMNCGYKLSKSEEISANDIEKLETIFSNQLLSNDDSSFKFGFRRNELKKTLLKINNLKETVFQNDKSKHFAVVVDGLNLISNAKEHFLLKAISNMKKLFSNIIFITRPLHDRSLYRSLKDSGVYYIEVPKNCYDDIFTIHSALALGIDAFVLTNDLFKDVGSTSFSNEDDITLFTKWMDSRKVRWSTRGIIIPPKQYLTKIQGNFKNFKKPFKLHFPVIYEGTDVVSNCRVEEWYHLSNVK